MSRVIFFRAKRKNWKNFPKGDQWVEGDVIHEPYGVVIQYYINNRRIKVVIDPETLCQDSGLRDGTKWEQLSETEKKKFLSGWNTEKNRQNQKEDWCGKRIWEKDIVDGHMRRGAAFYHSIVLWNEREARFDVKAMDCDFPITLNETADGIPIGGSDYIVIGNIFDN